MTHDDPMTGSGSVAPRPAVGVSSCLMGEPVRYDGTHRRVAWLADAAAHLELVPFCPEAAAGLGVPRPPLALVRGPGGGPRALRVGDPDVDETDRLEACARRLARGAGRLCGYVFKARSPSCAVDDAPLFDGRGRRVGRRAGLAAGAVQRFRPELPVIDEGGLAEAAPRDAFLEAVFALHRWQSAPPRSPEALAAFHRRHRFLLLSRGEAALAEAEARLQDPAAYLRCLMAVLRRPAPAEARLEALRALARRQGAAPSPALLARAAKGDPAARASLAAALHRAGGRVPPEPGAAICLRPYPPALAGTD